MSVNNNDSEDDKQIDPGVLADLNSGLTDVQEDFQRQAQELRDRRDRILSAMGEAMRRKSVEKARQELNND